MELLIFITIRIVLFIVLSVLLVAISWRSLHKIGSHGFYRFFAFEGTLLLILMNVPFWFKDPLSPLQLISWTLLSVSVVFVLQGIYLLRKFGGSKKRGKAPANYAFENTVKLVTSGIYKYIRHPMYCSLLLLAWGTFLKHTTVYGLLIAMISTGFLIATAKIEERENITFFGSRYREYMKTTKMFIPYLL